MMDLPSLFQVLGVSRYDAALPEGRISWRVPSGAVVARARCEVVLSFAALDGSVVYGADHVQLRAAGVPVLPLDGFAANIRPAGPMTEADAQRVAVHLASQRGA